MEEYKMKENKTTPEYFVGLDMGTSSLGWAVTDEHYHLLRFKGKDLWGVRMFDEAKTSAEARFNRTSRRRRSRERARIGLLYEFFADEIAKKDSGFYERIKDSKFHLEDKKEHVPFALFADTGYTDIEYYEEYPTIYHLRKELIESDQPHDVRLVFLALLNMFKARGHFLNEMLSVTDGIEKIEDLYRAFVQASEAVGKFCFIDLDEINMTKLDQSLCQKDISRTKKAELVGELLGIGKQKRAEYEIVKLICGLEGKLMTIFGDNLLDEEHKKNSLSFRAADFDLKLDEIENQLGEERLEFLRIAKRIHDYGLLGSIKKGYAYLSQARVEEYEKHKRDLKKLKMVIRKYAPDKYDSMFRTMEEDNYSAYVGSVNSGEKIRRNIPENNTEAKQAKLYKKITGILDNIPEDEDVIYIKTEIKKETFLPKQRTTANGVIPNQVHLAEMKKILQNAEKYLPFLAEKDEETDLTVSEKIIALYRFRIPYYVGPLKKGQGNAWVVRKNFDRVYPWNFENVVDTKRTAEAFIARMVRHCTYLIDEQALPKNSYLYERFMVLNELNNLKIRKEKPSVELKQEIYRDLFLKGKKVSRKALSDYLTARGILMSEEDEISGIDQDFHTSLTSIGKFKGIFGDQIRCDDTIKMMEDIIFWGTIYGEDKKFFRERVKDVYGEKLDPAQLKRISGLRFKDWGRLSRSFLEMEGCSKEDGQMLPLIEMMWQRNENLMELLSDRYTYMEELNRRIGMAEKNLYEFEYDDLTEMHLSAPVKRMVWQTLLVLKELREGLQHDPKRIFVEMARENQEKGIRTVSRKKRLQELYKNCKEEERDWEKELEGLDEAALRNKKLYLYYTQKGRCMYTGEVIKLSDLFRDNIYDIDHIYPKHFVKDDSLENNLVLVKKEKNANKKDIYPLDASIRQDREQWWRTLLSKDGKDGFITREKYERLIRNNEFTPEELSDFISRQIVETRQGTKAITKILKQVFPDTEIVYVKANNVSDFRRKYKLLKTRSVNDFHHARDAYLNIVVGNVYYVKFTQNPANFIADYLKDRKQNEYHMDKLFDYSIQRGDEVAWRAKKRGGEEMSITTVKRMMEKNTPLITRMTYEAHGGIADQTLYGAKKASAGFGYIPLKSKDPRMHDVSKYGGYGKVLGAYFFLVEHGIDGKRVRTLESMPYYKREELEQSAKMMERYCVNELGMINPSIRVKKIKMQSLIRCNGFYFYITGRSNQQLIVDNAVPLCLKSNWLNYVKKLENAKERGWLNEKEISQSKNLELYRELQKKHTQTIYQNRKNPVGDKLKNAEHIFETLPIESQCKVLLQILQLTQLSNRAANLSEINLPKNTGKMNINKKITDNQEFILIHESPAGLYRTETNLLTI